MRCKIGISLLMGMLIGCDTGQTGPTPTPMAYTSTPMVDVTVTATVSPALNAAVIPTSTPRPTSTPPAWSTPTGDDNFLPAPLYYVSLRKDENGQQCPLPHIVRMERDGRTRAPIGSCFIIGGINGFDVSSADGSVVLAAEGSLWITDADGKNARKLVAGLPNPEIAGKLFDIQAPVWSPDGKYVAYADGGIRILDIATGARTDVIESRCFTEERLGLGYPPCQYGVWYMNPRWSPDGKAILFLEQNSEYPIQHIFVPLVDSEPSTVPGTLGVTDHNVVWTQDGMALLFDYWWPAIASITSTEPAFVRVSRDDFDVQVLWPHGDRADPVFFSSANNPRQVRYPFEAPDGRILFFQAEPCGTGSCYHYALVEGTHTDDGFSMRVLRRNALPPGAHDLIWHDSAEFIAFLAGDSDGLYVGVMQVNTGETFLLAEEDAQHLFPIVWGNP